MAYCILRVAKIKSRASLARSMQHNTRERQPDNANPERKRLNAVKYSTQAAMARYTERLPEKVRSNAVHAVEFMVALPPEVTAKIKTKADMDEAYKYLARSVMWISNRMGGDENILNVTVHVDERTPHLHLTMMPLKDGKLNYRSYLGGHRDALIKLQTDFAKEVGATYGLERGRPRSETGRRHITVGRYYAIGADAVAKVIERQKEQARLDREHRERIAPAVAEVKKAEAKKSKSRDKGMSR